MQLSHCAAINAGSTSSVPGGATIGSFLGSDHFDSVPGTDLLPILAGAPTGGSGFTAPLGPGTYTYLVQQTSPNPSSYALDFNVVPEPSSVAILLVLSSLMLVRFRKN